MGMAVALDWLRNIVRLALAFTFSVNLTAPCSSSPGIIVANTHSVGASLVVWLASGLLAWTGASSFAELGCDNSYSQVIFIAT